MTDYESEQDVIAELVNEFPTVPARIITNILHAYLETNSDLEHAAAAARVRIDDALHHG
jgi:hypothetical protein